MSSILTLPPYMGAMARQTQATRSYSSTQDPAMQRAHRIRLNPTPEQEVYFRKAAGTARFVYNWALDQWQTVYAEHPGTPYGMMAAKKDFNALKAGQFPWVYDVAKDIAEGAFTNVAAALKNYFASKSGKRKG